MTSESSLAYDPVTSLPLSSAVLAKAVSLAQDHDIHVIYVDLHKLAEVGAVYGDRIAHLLFRQAVRRLRSLIGPHDFMARHTGTSLLILTAGPPEELHDLPESISRQIRALAILTRGVPLPEARVGMATALKVASEQEGRAAVDAAVAAAGRAARGQEAGQGQVAPAPIDAEQLSESPPVPSAVRVGPERAPGEAIAIRRIGIAMEGAEATATVTLTWGAREGEAEAVGANTPRDRLVLVGEATATAVMILGALEGTLARVSVDELSRQGGRFVHAVVEIKSPGGPEQLSATIPIQGTTYSTAARAVVQAMKPRLRDIRETP